LRILAAVAAAVLLLLAAGCGSGAATATTAAGRTAASPVAAKRLMVQRLRRKQLDYTWLACVRVGRSYQGIPITRCNVGFGIDPHVEAYCVLLEDGRLVTNHDDPTIPCKHDDAGWDGTTLTTGG
jgi:hypothetical protein